MTRRAAAAFALASGAVIFMALGLVENLVFAWQYPLLLLGATVGLVLAVIVWLALHARCSTGARWADPVAGGTVLLMAPLGFFGVSFGGLALLQVVPLLAIAHVLTPRAR